MTHKDEIPTDETVCAALRKLGRATARDLVHALVESNFDTRDAQRGIQRCLDRGKITLGSDLRLEAAEARELAAA